MIKKRRNAFAPFILKYNNTKRVIDWVKENFKEGEILFSLMSQFTPIKSCNIDSLNRRLTEEEYNEIEDYLFRSGIEDGFMQELSSASEEYVPPFDLGDYINKNTDFKKTL